MRKTPRAPGSGIFDEREKREEVTTHLKKWFSVLFKMNFLQPSLL